MQRVQDAGVLGPCFLSRPLYPFQHQLPQQQNTLWDRLSVSPTHFSFYFLVNRNMVARTPCNCAPCKESGQTHMTENGEHAAGSLLRSALPTGTSILASYVPTPVPSPRGPSLCPQSGLCRIRMECPLLVWGNGTPQPAPDFYNVSILNVQTEPRGLRGVPPPNSPRTRPSGSEMTSSF